METKEGKKLVSARTKQLHLTLAATLSSFLFSDMDKFVEEVNHILQGDEDSKARLHNALMMWSNETLNQYVREQVARNLSSAVKGKEDDESI
jgi:hypothetical protein